MPRREMMAYEDYLANKDNPEYKKKMHKEALKKRGEMQQCPVCKVYESYITNFHCVSQHGMTKKQVELEHGAIFASGQFCKSKKGASK